MSKIIKRRKERFTMKKLKFAVIFVLLTGVVLAACQPELPVDIPPDDDFVYGEEAIVESLEVLLLESFPLQASAIVSGSLPDGCTKLYEIDVAREGQEFILTVVTRRETGDVVCTMALEPFAETVDLDIEGFEAGTYTVIAQDQEAKFTLDVDNVLEEDPIAGRDDMLISSNAYIEGLSLEVLESDPVQVRARLTGNLPDGCTKIHEIRSSRDGNIFTIQVKTETPAGDVACTMALVPFEESHDLEVEGLPAGEYTVRVDDLRETFSLDTDN